MHLGQREGWREGSIPLPHSDTLFSALCHVDWMLNGTIGENELSIIRAVRSVPIALLLSSCFPFIDKELFWPVPLNQLSMEKDVRRIRYIDTAGFAKLLHGEKIDNIYEGHRTIPDWRTGETPWIIQDVPRVSLNRWTNHPDENYFHVGQVSFKKGAGFFFSYAIDDNWSHQQFETMMRLLADEGLGGYRSVGYGLSLPPIFTTIDLDAPDDSDGVVHLSLYYPARNQNISYDLGFYEMIERRGYIFSPFHRNLHKRSLRMFVEGSVFSDAPENQGEIVDITPTAPYLNMHKVYRYGLPFTLKCKL